MQSSEQEGQQEQRIADALPGPAKERRRATFPVELVHNVLSVKLALIELNTCIIGSKCATASKATVLERHLGVRYLDASDETTV